MEDQQSKLFDVCNIYIWLWLLWFVQGMFLSNSLISMLFYIPYLLMTFFLVIKTYTFIRPKGAMFALCVFFAILVVYGVALVILNDARGQDRKSFLMMLFSSLGPIFSFYTFTKQGLLTEKKIKAWFIVFLCVATIDYFVTQRNSLAIAMENLYKYEEVTNNSTYSFVGLVPFVFLLRKKPILQYITLFYLYYFIVSGLKRGAMLTGALLLVWVVFVSMNTTSKEKKWGIVLLTVIALIIGYRFIMQLYENSDYFQIRVEKTLDGSSSNRNVIYETLWHHYRDNDNIIQLAFGEGAYHTENVTQYKAHNDWLELLIDCGIITVLIYLFYWICFVHDCRKSRSNSLIYSMLGACLIFSFTRTLFSMSFSNMPFYTSMIIGYCFALVNSNNFILNENTCSG